MFFSFKKFSARHLNNVQKEFYKVNNRSASVCSEQKSRTSYLITSRVLAGWELRVEKAGMVLPAELTVFEEHLYQEFPARKVVKAFPALKVQALRAEWKVFREHSNQEFQVSLVAAPLLACFVIS
jgi:hypothetical protein